MSKKMMWLPGRRVTKGKISSFTRACISNKADALVESTIKPKYIKPPPSDHDFNFLVDVFTKWHGKYFYFCAKYNCPSPNAISPFFEINYARLECISEDVFILSYQRHTGAWVEVGDGLSLDDCLKTVAEDPIFTP